MRRGEDVPHSRGGEPTDRRDGFFDIASPVIDSRHQVAVEIPELCRYMAELVWKQAEFMETPESIHQYRLDSTHRTKLAGPCRVPWRDGVRRMVAARHPELQLQG